MAKVTQLTAGRSAATSAPFNVPAYGSVVVAPFSPDTNTKSTVPPIRLVLVGTAGPSPAGEISASGPPVVVSNPTGETMTYRVERDAYDAQKSEFDSIKGEVGIEVTGAA